MSLFDKFTYIIMFFYDKSLSFYDKYKKGFVG